MGCGSSQNAVKIVVAPKSSQPAAEDKSRPIRPLNVEDSLSVGSKSHHVDGTGVQSRSDKGNENVKRTGFQELLNNEGHKFKKSKNESDPRIIQKISPDLDASDASMGIIRKSTHQAYHVVDRKTENKSSTLNSSGSGTPNSVNYVEIDKNKEKANQEAQPTTNSKSELIVEEIVNHHENALLDNASPSSLNSTSSSSSKIQKHSNEIYHGSKERLSKRDLFSSCDKFSNVDRHALEAPASCKNTFQSLAIYLTQPFNSELMKFRAIWRWVTSNIEYDTDTFFGGKSSVTEDNANILQSGKGICDGYASLVTELCRFANLEIRKVSGHAKGFYYRPGNVIKGNKSNHAWNAVKIKAQWWLCDFTWGAGYVGDDKEFVWNYTEHYFLTDPEEFILDHFPVDEEWQLLSSAYTIEQFQSWAKLYKHFFINRLKPLSHREGIIDVSDGTVQLAFETKIPLQISCKLTRTVENSIKDEGQYSFQYIDGNKAIFQARLPEIGDYDFKLYAQKATDDSVKSYDCVAYYILRCSNTIEDIQTFPKTYSSWTEGFILHEPTTGVLSRNKTISFRLTAVDVIDMAVCIRGGKGDWITLTQTAGNSWSGDVKCEEDAEEATVVIKKKGQKSTTFSSILKYTVK